MCDRSARLEGLYLVFVFTIAQGFLAARCVRYSTSCLDIVFELWLNEMKVVWADRAQRSGAVGIFSTHSGLRRDGVTHGFLTGDKRYVSFHLKRHRLFSTGVHFA